MKIPMATTITTAAPAATRRGFDLTNSIKREQKGKKREKKKCEGEWKTKKKRKRKRKKKSRK